MVAHFRMIGLIASALLLLPSLLAMAGCDEGSRAGITSVKINGKTFYLEEAITKTVRNKGLGQRTNIEPNGGMIFGFTDKDVQVQSFVMRDCPIPIDIIYLDGSGRVLSWYEMQPLTPRGPGEGNVGEYNEAYERRIEKTKYSSKFPAQFVIELKGGTIPSLNLKEGMQLKFDYEDLKKRVQ